MRRALTSAVPTKVVVVLAFATLVLGACVQVRPHQREHLAHPAMQAPVWPAIDQADQHTFLVREGTGGATGTGGGGCGCN